jgi:hypothetical protein
MHHFWSFFGGLKRFKRTKSDAKMQKETKSDAKMRSPGGAGRPRRRHQAVNRGVTQPNLGWLESVNFPAGLLNFLEDPVYLV